MNSDLKELLNLARLPSLLNMTQVAVCVGTRTASIFVFAPETRCSSEI